MLPVRPRRWPPRWLFATVLSLGLGPGCGARTGLEAPEPRLEDLGEPQRRAPPPDPEICLVASGRAAFDNNTPLEVRVTPRVRVADAVLLIDETSSMADEIDNIRRSLLGAIVPGVRLAVPGAHFAVASFGEFPVGRYGERGDVPLRIGTRASDRTGPLVDALARISARGGGDVPEPAVEALYQLATGEGLPPWIAPGTPCPSPAQTGPLCLRPDAQPIVLVFTDAPTHNGPGPDHAYLDAEFTLRGAPRGPHRYDEALTALRRVGAAVIGINSAASASYNPLGARHDLEQLAHDTGAVSDDGAPLVFDIGADGSGLDLRVVDAVRAFVASGRLEVSARIIALDGAVVEPGALRPLRPLRAEPPTGVERLDASAFYNARPGTQLVFAFSLPDRPFARTPPGDRHARVQFYANARPSLGAVDVRVVESSTDLSTAAPCARGAAARDR